MPEGVKDHETHRDSGAVKYAGVDVDHPSIVSTIRNVARNLGDNDQARAHAMRISGMPKEIVDKHFTAVVEERKRQ